jgi:hypothetical protein
MTEAVSTPETLANFYETTQRNIPEVDVFTLAAVRSRNLIKAQKALSQSGEEGVLQVA